ncbi:ef hand family protein [Stylonychia lemnae]|uniref:Ef hand family protein n=1 Tax=Stylonychia lemnae TaxID=5949 RepID=A0A078A2T9_STYLE|nr:ef hand family protein [Stylonychia lemnae]|eukprot:CDW76593.1 ef hand family protein [Stylonychia lemnae]
MSVKLNDTYYSTLQPSQTGGTQKKIAKIDIEKLKQIRSTKQLLKQRLRTQDLEKSQSVPIRTFELEMYKVGITLQNRDMDFLIQKYSDPQKSQNILYEEVIRSLVPELRNDSSIKWTIQQSVKDQIRGVDTVERSHDLSNRKILMHRRNSKEESQSNFQSSKSLNKTQNFKNMFQSMHEQRKKMNESGMTISQNQKDNLSMSQTYSNKDIYQKITIKTPINELDSYISKDLSSASKSLNIFKNKQNSKYIKASINNTFDIQERDRIRRFLKKDNIDIRHLNDIKSAFLSCEQQPLGLVKKSDFLFKLYKMNLKFPQDFFISMLKTIQEDPDDESDDAILSYIKLRGVIDVQMSCPSRLKGDSNNSNSFKVSLEYQTDIKNASNDKTDKLIRYVHMRIEEKFKDFRHAFRGFDRNYDGNLSFKEFMGGLENIGIRLSLEDFLKIFQVLDYDQTGEIDFFKFCLLNTDKMKDTHNYMNTLKQQQDQQEPIHRKKPPLPHMIQLNPKGGQGQPKLHSFAEGIVPKNKDYSGFNKDIQEPTPLEKVRKYEIPLILMLFRQRRQIKLPASNSFAYGIHNEQQFKYDHICRFEHDMPAIMSNQYQDQEVKVKKEPLKYYSSTPMNKSTKSIDLEQTQPKKNNKILLGRVNMRDKFVNRSQKDLFQRNAARSLSRPKDL